MFVDTETVCMCQLARLNLVGLQLSIFYFKITCVSSKPHGTERINLILRS